jgi:hypothetical protein
VNEMPFNDFLYHSLNKLISNKVNIKLVNSSNVEFSDGNSCSGYFSGGDDKEDLEFSVATDSNQYKLIYIHEYCHFLQWKNKKSLWYSLDPKEEEIFWDWLVNPKKRVSKKRIVDISKRIRELEADCERMAVKTIKRWDIDIDVEDYKKKANSYIYFYSILPEVRSWFKNDSPPYIIDEIMDIMPNRFVKNYDDVPEGYLDLIKKYCL